MGQQQPRGSTIPAEWGRMERLKHADEVNDGLLGYAVAFAAPGFPWPAAGRQGGSHELVEEAGREDEQSVEAEDWEFG
jgi:hypothetical protein